MHTFKYLFAVLFPIVLIIGCSSQKSQTFETFVTASGDRLMQGDQEFRFISFNIPNLHYIEDNMKFTQPNPWRLSNEFEIRDALSSIQQMGGQVARIYTLSVKKADDSPETPRHILGPGEFNEEAFVVLDKVLQVANEKGVRIIIPFVDNWSWWGGRAEYAAFRDKSPDEFWTDAQIIADFKKTIEFVVTRTNTFTGRPYSEDKAILAWETGNELTSPQSWTSEIAAYIKSLDSNHLVIDGFHSSLLRDASLAEANVDLVTTHHYEKDPGQMVQHIQQNMEKARGTKPYFIGEFGFIDTDGVRQVLDTVISGNCSGALLWSLRFHNRDGGFYWHSEPYGGNLFKAYHWPGFPSGEPFDETACLNLMRQKAYDIQQKQMPALQPPDAPTLLPIKDVAAISWQGSAGASTYNVERAEEESGPWQAVGQALSDADVQYRPLFNDTTVELGQTYVYRVVAQNSAGQSSPSNSVQAPVVEHFTLVDECRDWNKTFRVRGQLQLKRDEARPAKEDAHRFRGNAGDGVVYRCPGNILAFKIYAFFPADIQDLKFSVSADGENFSPIAAQSTNYYSGQGEYNYYKPVEFSSATMPKNIKFLNIEFPCPVELSRVEVNYGN